MQQPMQHPMQHPMQQPMYGQQGPMMMRPSSQLQRRMNKLEASLKKEKYKNNRSSLTKNVLGTVVTLAIGGLLLGSVLATCAFTAGVTCSVFGIALIAIASILIVVGIILLMFAVMAAMRM